MGGSSYSDSDYSARSALRSSTAKAKGIDYVSATFAHSHSIDTGVITAAVHASLNPKGVNLRESRDSVEHPVAVPIAVILDVTGSMAGVPIMIQAALPKLMGCFLNDKASGKRYLGDGYPAILIGAVDDYDAMRGDNCLQVGQFESGCEVDNDLTNLWLTRNGGGTYSESYELGMYFMARHTVHDHWDKRGRKGYCFLIGDEHPYQKVKKEEVEKIIGDSLQSDISTADIVKELKDRYHVFMIIPAMTSHYGDPKLERAWVDLLGQQNVIKLDQPDSICQCIVSAVAICEENVGVDDLTGDLGIDPSLAKALVPLSKSGSGLSRHSADGLMEVVGATSGSERL